MYDTPNELLAEILAGEDSTLDFKDVTRKGNEVRLAPKRADEGRATAELAKDLSCFANTDGGVMVFGVRDDKERVGMSGSDADLLQRLVVDVAQDGIEPPMGHLVSIQRIFLPDSAGEARLCVKVEIKRAFWGLRAPKGRRPYFRIADHCREMTLDQQARAFERRGMLPPFEERPVLAAPGTALDLDRFRAYCETRYGDAPGVPVEDLQRRMKNLKLLGQDEAGGSHPTGLGLLLFCREPERWIGGAYVDIAAYSGDVADADGQRDAKTLRGTIIEQIEDTVRYLQTSPLVPIRATKDGTGRLDAPAYSLRALQEGVVNALVHRDYSVAGSQVRILLFSDRIEVWSPGALPNTITPEDLYAGCQPVRRNQMLAGFLRDYTSPITGRAYMEARGEGFLTMVRECERTSGQRPDLRIVSQSVNLTFHARGAMCAPVAPGGPR